MPFQKKQPSAPTTSKVIPLEYDLVNRKVLVDGKLVTVKAKVYREAPKTNDEPLGVASMQQKKVY